MGLTIRDAIEELENTSNIRFDRLLKICQHFFGDYRNNGSSHYIFKTPWPGDPRINVQRDGSKAKVYQVKQVIKCLHKLEEVQNDNY